MAFHYRGTSCCEECWQGDLICETGEAGRSVSANMFFVCPGVHVEPTRNSLIVPKRHKKTPTVRQTWQQLTLKTVSWSI